MLALICVLMKNRLRVARADKGKRGVNQFQVAKAIGVGRDRYLRIELEYTEPTDDEIAALARYFAKPADDLFPGYRQKSTGGAEAAAS